MSATSRERQSLNQFGAVLDQWFEQKQHELEQSTADEYRRQIENHIRPAFGDWSLGEIRPQDLETWYANLRKSYGPATIRRLHSITRQAFDQARRYGLVKVNPASDARGVPSVKLRAVRPEEVPDEEVVRAILADAKKYDPDLAVILRFVATSCCRPGEATGLLWWNLNLDTQVCTIDGALDIKVTPVRRKVTKTEDVRRIPLDSATCELLRGWKGTRSVVPRHIRPEAYVFSQRTGLPLRQDTFRDRLNVVAERVGEHVTPKMFRHFGATQLLSRGVSPVEVAARLGHTSPMVTLTVYAHAVPARGREAADLLGGLLD